MALDIQNTSNHDIFEPASENIVSGESKNILVITQNHLDLTLIKKLLESMGNHKVYEAGNLKTAFKVTSHIRIDLIIVDEKLPTAEGFEIIDRFSKKSMLREIPKILLITNDFQKERYEYYRDTNLDFMKKPIDTVLLKARVNTLFKNMTTPAQHSCVFEEMINAKLQDAKSFLTIYKSFMNIDENILFIYDDAKKRVLESNAVFRQFFGDEERFNKVLSQNQFIRKFVPYMDDSNYINRYNPDEWMDIIKAAEGFNLGIKIVKNHKEYSFSILHRKIELADQEMYIIKFLNNHHYLPNTKLDNMQQCRDNVNEELSHLKTELEKEEEERSYRQIFTMLQKISEEVNGNSKVKVLEVDIYAHHKINAYFVIASMLKEYAETKTIYLNSIKVDHTLEENREEIYLKIQPDVLRDAVKGIIDSYFTANVLYDKRKINVTMYETDEHLNIEILTSERKEKVKELSMLDKILRKNELTFSYDHKDDILPKSVYHAIDVLHANVKRFSKDGHLIFILTIPLSKKVK